MFQPRITALLAQIVDAVLRKDRKSLHALVKSSNQIVSEAALRAADDLSGPVDARDLEAVRQWHSSGTALPIEAYLSTLRAGQDESKPDSVQVS